MRSWTIAFSVGVVLAALLPVLPSPDSIIACCACAVLLQRWGSLRVVGALLLGAGWLCWCGSERLAQRWPEPPFQRDVWVEATVWNLPITSGDSQRLQLRLDKLCLSTELAQCDFAALPDDGRLVQISVYEPLTLRPGQRWRWLLRLKPPHGFVNPGGFDYEAWLLQQGISATGYLRANAANTLLSHEPDQRRLQQWRYALAQPLATAGADLQYPQLLRALIIGDGSGITDSEWQLFAETGTTHLLVISGSHVALIVVLLYWLGYWLGSRWHRLLLHVPATWPAALFALTGSWIYTGLAGFSLPAQRAWVMAAVMLLARLWRRQLQPWNSLLLALAAVLAVDPLAILNTGFWLSFVAVAVLLVSGLQEASAIAGWRRWLRAAWELLLLQWRMSIALLPIVLVCFQQTSLLAPLVNLPLIPLLGAVVVPLALAGAVLAGLWLNAGLGLLKVADVLLSWSMEFLQWSTSVLPANMLVLPTLGTFGLGALVVAVLVALLGRRRWQRVVGFAAVPLVFFTLQTPTGTAVLHMQILDVGQGLAITVSTPHHQLLYDTGPQFSTSFDAGADVVVPVLRQSNVRLLDRVVISHADQDHAGGLPAVLATFPAARYFSSQPGLFPPAATSDLCRAGQHWQWDSVSFSVLHPDDGRYDDNNGSCVLLIEAAGHQLLLAGDIEKPTELLLLQRYPTLTADVLIAPHHGSRSSSSAAFLNQLQPQVVVYSTGYQNRFNHPAAEVQARYRRLQAQAFNTARDGAVTIAITAAGALETTAERQTHPRFWRHGSP